jgi:hypothetical protein
MKSLQVIKVAQSENISLKNGSLLLENLADMNKIECINWKEFPYKPKVEFRIGHCDDHIFLKFYVTENSVRAMETGINGDVYKDSCVEFFISFDGNNYYNFEFSCIGTPHIAWGNGRYNRVKLPPEVVATVKVKSSLGNELFNIRTGTFTWDLMSIIPATCFIHDPELVFSGLSANGNFYKCGDLLPEPHFVTWNPVGTPHPDYHQPVYFGKTDFE